MYIAIWYIFVVTIEFLQELLSLPDTFEKNLPNLAIMLHTISYH